MAQIGISEPGNRRVEGSQRTDKQWELRDEDEDEDEDEQVIIS